MYLCQFTWNFGLLIENSFRPIGNFSRFVIDNLAFRQLDGDFGRLPPMMSHGVFRGLRGGDTCWLEVSDDNVALGIFYGLKISKFIPVGLDFHFHFCREEHMLSIFLKHSLVLFEY